MLSLSNIDNITLIQVVLIFFLGGMVKGLIGVGLPTVTLTLLSFIFDIKDSISIILLPVIFTNLYQMFDGKHLKKIINEIRTFLLSSFLFIIPGFYFLVILKSDTILFILALLLIINSSLSLAKYEIKLKNYKSNYVQFFIGSMTGMTTGVTSIYTMPFVFLIQSLNYSKDKIIQLMGLSFFIFGSTQFILFNAYKMIDTDKLILSLISCIPILSGVYLGTVLRKNISENLFKILFNLMLAFMGFILILKVIF